MTAMIPVKRLLLAFLALVPLAAFAADSAKLQVLLVTGGHGFEKEPFLKVFTDNPAISFVHAEHNPTNASAFDRDDLPKYDVVVLYDMPTRITEAQKTRFLSLFEKGTGLVVMHHALCSYPDWPDYERIIGGRYPAKGEGADKAGYEHDVDFPVNVLAKDHPVTSGITDFTIHDEIYWGFRVGTDVKPLLTTTHPKSGKPLAWTRTEKKSRVVYLQLGHDHQAYENPAFSRLVGNAIQWAGGR